MAHRTADSAREVDKHGAGKDGYTEGSPPSIPATIVNEDAADMWQEEICVVVESDGITLATEASPDNTQLTLIIGRRALGIYGDGNDGSITQTGGTLTLTEDLYASSILVESSGTIETNGFRIFCTGTTQVDSGCFIQNNGAPGAATLGGDGGVLGTLGAGGDGGDGGAVANGNGVAGTNLATSGYGGSGGAGGGGGTGGAGGAGGTSARTNTHGDPFHVPRCLDMYAIDPVTGIVSYLPGAGGGGGGADAVNNGGGGGGGGGIVVLCSRFVINNGTIQAVGGAGQVGAGANHGAGGGGGGGLVITVSRGISGSGIVLVSGGAGGTGANPGVAGGIGRGVTLFH